MNLVRSTLMGPGHMAVAVEAGTIRTEIILLSVIEGMEVVVVVVIAIMVADMAMVVVVEAVVVVITTVEAVVVEDMAVTELS